MCIRDRLRFQKVSVRISFNNLACLIFSKRISLNPVWCIRTFFLWVLSQSVPCCCRHTGLAKWEPILINSSDSFQYFVGQRNLYHFYISFVTLYFICWFYYNLFWLSYIIFSLLFHYFSYYLQKQPGTHQHSRPKSGGDDGNRTRVRKHFRRTFSERIFCFKISPLKTPRSRLFHQLSRCSLMLPGFHMKFSCMLDTVHPAYR